MADTIFDGPADRSGGAILTNPPNDESVSVLSIGATCLVYRPGSGSAGPVIFDLWDDLIARLDQLRVDAGGEICGDLTFDDSVISPAVIPARIAPYNVSGMVWKGRPNAVGNFVSIDAGATFLGLRSFDQGIQVENNSITTSPVSDLADGDIITLDQGASVFSIFGGTPFFAVTGGITVVILVRGSSTLGFGAPGPAISMPDPGAFLFIGLEGIGGLIREVLSGGAGAFLLISTSTMHTIPTIFPNWAGTVLDPRLDDPASILPLPYLGPPSIGSIFAAAPSTWLRFDSTPGPIAQILPTINSAFNSQTSPGEFLVVSHLVGAGGLTIAPDVGDTLNGGVAPIVVPAGGSFILMGDGVSNWQIISAFP